MSKERARRRREQRARRRHERGGVLEAAAFSDGRGDRRGFGDTCEHVDASLRLAEAIHEAGGTIDEALIDAFIDGNVVDMDLERSTADGLVWRCPCGKWHVSVSGVDLDTPAEGAEEASLAARLEPGAVHIGGCALCGDTWVDPEPGERCSCGFVIVAGGA